MNYQRNGATVHPYAMGGAFSGGVTKPVSELVREIENLKANANQFKEQRLGNGFLKWTEQFYSLERVPFSDAGGDTVFPLLQYLFLIEANDLTDSVPLFYIHKEKSNGPQRLKEIELIIRNLWREENWNLEFLYATLWSLLVGVGFVEFGLDSSGKDGEGKVWGKSVNPLRMFVDPHCTTLDDAWYIMKEDMKYIDEIRMLYPYHADEIMRKARKGIPEVTQFMGLEMPTGPMRSVFGADNARLKTTDGMFLIRTLWIKDSSVMEVERERIAEIKGLPVKSVLPPPRFVRKYPYGRMLVECEGTILYDSPNPYRSFPFVDVHATPPIQGFWNPPPLKFTASMQSTAQELINQLLDNCARLNKGMIFIKENTQISLEEFGGVAGEVHVIPANSDYPHQMFPPAFPPQMTELPFKVLEYQKEMQGFNEARLGQMKGGNISSSLQDGASTSSMAITRLRTKLLGRAIQRASEIILSIMQDYYLEPRYYLDYFGLEKVDREEENPYLKLNPMMQEKLTVRLDPGSIEPLSATSLRTMVPLLRNMGLIDVKHALEFLRIPDRDEIFQTLQQEAQAAAAAHTQAKSHHKK